MPRPSVVASLAAVALAALFAAGCECSQCIKDPPCRPCEDPCCLTPIQKTALAGGTHALGSGPVAYVFEEKTYILFTEQGQKDFQKDPAAFAEKGAIRLTRAGKTWRMDVNPGDDVDFAGIAAGATPYVPAPK